MREYVFPRTSEQHKNLRDQLARMGLDVKDVSAKFHNAYGDLVGVLLPDRIVHIDPIR